MSNSLSLAMHPPLVRNVNSEINLDYRTHSDLLAVGYALFLCIATAADLDVESNSMKNVAGLINGHG